MNYLNAVFKIVALHSDSARNQIRALVRCLSQLLVLFPGSYLVVGRVEGDELQMLLARIKWFYASIVRGRVLIRGEFGWMLYPVRHGQLEAPRSAGVFLALLTALTGKILVFDYNNLWLKLDWLLNYKVFVINWTKEHRISAWRFAASVASNPLASLEEGGQRRDDRPRSMEVVIVGNGPSAYRIFDRRFDGMDVIVCNTAIKSRRLLAERNVVALGFIDAAFFIGPSAYSIAFYKALDESVRLRDFSIYIDYEHEACVRQRTPSLSSDRIFPVYLSGATPVRPDFKKLRAQRSGNSVFTSILLPLAATHYRKIYLVGFDGKDPSMKNYFWKHSDEFQFNDLLSTVKESDAGFFSKRDYDEYNRRNAEEIECCIAGIEKDGVKVIMTHPSFIEPLQRRYEANRESEPVETVN